MEMVYTWIVLGVGGAEPKSINLLKSTEMCPYTWGDFMVYELYANIVLRKRMEGWLGLGSGLWLS